MAVVFKWSEWECSDVIWEMWKNQQSQIPRWACLSWSATTFRAIGELHTPECCGWPIRIKYFRELCNKRVLASPYLWSSVVGIVVVSCWDCRRYHSSPPGEAWSPQPSDGSPTLRRHCTWERAQSLKEWREKQPAKVPLGFSSDALKFRQRGVFNNFNN